ncbi:hypothetical protein [Algibacter sp. L3A6]|uniref:hypothetical protein n=1 Tax=Algibacter sp. L3A6 TaxID=2686366 RepID=UPI00131D5F7D|nr:hypothetical protein [Algibacter sp. L3A6]
MKNLVYIILGFVIGAALTYYFCPRPLEGAVAEIDNPTGTITILEATELSANWEKNNPKEIDSTIELDDNSKRKPMRSVMWSLKNIEDYIAFAEKESDSVGYTMTGLRVYLGNYGKNGKPGKKNRNTMFIVPTGYENTSKASSLGLNFSYDERDIPVDPLNDGGTGETGYP